MSRQTLSFRVHAGLAGCTALSQERTRARLIHRARGRAGGRTLVLPSARGTEQDEERDTHGYEGFHFFCTHRISKPG